ncbi:MAG: nitronate monooxygenase [Thermomicrobiales bacterium]|jgi:nitronate monooxygenase|nr:nitronate monooxygenase [Thermomicrobiales bacterium]
MAIRTALTEVFGLEYPIVLAPMGQVAGGRLAAAVSNAGALGVVGGAYGDPEWLHRELSLVQAETDRPWGVGLITWYASPEVVDLALSYHPAAFLLSFGDIRPYVDAIKAAGCTLLCQVQEIEAARDVVAAGADVVVAQGHEAGGHCGLRATLPLVPAVVDAVAPVPVLAAGGIADGRGVAAALMLGAQGAVLGTRFSAASEALTHERAKAQMVAARAADTVQTRVFDIIRGYGAWPAPYVARALRNDFFARWHGRDGELEATLEAEMPTYQRAVATGDFRTAMILAGEAVDLIDAIVPAADLVQRIGAAAEARLRAGPGLLA